MKVFKYALACVAALFVSSSWAQSWCSGGPVSFGANAATTGAPYPSTITIANAATSIGTFGIGINGLTHSYPGDLDLLLVGPGGQKIIIQSDVAGTNDAVGTSYVISDAGAALMPDAAALTVNTWKPTNYDTNETTFPAPAPAGPYSFPAPAGSATFASVFGGTNPNGTWSLYASDDASGDGGAIANWCIRLGAPLKISEFRVRGPNGANDEYIEVLNDSPVPTTVASIDGSPGFAIAASNGVARCLIPNDTVIAAYGHYLCTNSVGYSLSGYPAGSPGTASGNATYTTDIPDNAGLALFRTSVAASFNLANRLDAVGSTSEANTLYKEGTGYPALTPFSIDYTFHRDTCGKQGSITSLSACPNAGFAQDTNNNATDFVFVDTNGTSAGAGQRLGSPGPENLSSPTRYGPPLTPTRLDTCVALRSPPNQVRDFTSDPANNSTFGTLDVRRTITNNTGSTITRLRYRIAEIATFPAPSGFADLRPRTSTALVTTVDRPPCGTGASNTTVVGTTLEQPPSQPNGGGFNTTLSVPVGAGLAPGESLDVRFLFGIQQTGMFKILLVPEAIPAAGGFFDSIRVTNCTDGCDVIFRDSFDAEQ